MKDRTESAASAARRALAERAIKGGAIESGAAQTRAAQRRARTSPSGAQPPEESIVTRGAAEVDPRMREAMISESAYYRSAHRGFEPGQEVDDWLAAESEIDAALARGDSPSLCG